MEHWHGKRKRIFVGLSLIGLILVVLLPKDIVRAQGQNDPKGSPSCPLHSRDDWQNFLNEVAGNPKWVETCEDSTCDKKFFSQVASYVKGTLDACAPAIAADEKIAKCTENLRTFTPAWMRQHDSYTYGFNVDNSVYLAAQEADDKPKGMMTIPQAIVDALPDRERVEAAARENGWKYLTHDSALHGIRTFVYISDPNGGFDQWFLLNLKGPGEKNVTKGMPVSIVAVQKKTGAGEPLDKIRIFFRDYNLDDRGPKVKLSVNPNGNGKCYACHASGMRQLIPRRTIVTSSLPVKGEPNYGESVSADEFGYNRLVEFNKTIRRYGPNDWDGMVVPTQHGPMLGGEFGCVKCHNNEARGALTVSTSVVQLKRKMTLELAMPPSETLQNYLERAEMNNPPLNDEEKANLKEANEHSQELFAAFMESRFPELKKWILQSSCL